jgi:DNA-binding MarR family transcriptional regulator
MGLSIVRLRDDEKLRAIRERTLYRLLTRAYRAQNTKMVERLRAMGYPDLATSYPGLLANLDTGGTIASALAAKAGITRQAAGQRLREIEAHGYVERQPDPHDRRAVLVQRTRKGKALLRDAIKVVTELEAEYAHYIGRASLDQLRDLLSELLQHIDPIGRLSRD